MSREEREQWSPEKTAVMLALVVVKGHESFYVNTNCEVVHTLAGFVGG